MRAKGCHAEQASTCITVFHASDFDKPRPPPPPQCRDFKYLSVCSIAKHVESMLKCVSACSRKTDTRLRHSQPRLPSSVRPAQMWVTFMNKQAQVCFSLFTCTKTLQLAPGKQVGTGML